jgi:hypothetical protein
MIPLKSKPKVYGSSVLDMVLQMLMAMVCGDFAGMVILIIVSYDLGFN